MSNIGERFQLLREYFEISQSQWAEQLGVSRATIARIESGNIEADKYIKNITAYANIPVNVDWLKTGNGEMLEQESIGKQIEILLNEQDKGFIAMVKAYYSLNTEERKSLNKYYESLGQS